MIPGVSIQPLPAGGYRLEFNRARNKPAAFASLFALAFLSWGMLFLHEIGQHYLLAAVALMALFCLASTLRQWIEKQTVEIDPHRLTFHSDYLGLRFVRSLGRNEIIDMQPSSGTVFWGRQYYNITLTLRDHRTYKWRTQCSLEQVEGLMGRVGERAT